MSKRLLAVYDFSTQPANLEQLTLFQAATLVLLAYFQLDKVDVCFILNEAKQLSQPELAMERILELLPIVQFNPQLGAVFIRENNQQLQDLIATEQYHEVWPPIGNRQNLFFPAMQLIAAYHQELKVIPSLFPRQVMQHWAGDFFASQVMPQAPVTVNLDNATGLDEWCSLFSHCEKRYPVKFVLLAETETVNQHFRGLPNVLIAYDHFITLEQEMTLVMMALTHLGSNSGLAAVANLTGKALALFDTPRANLTAYEGSLIDYGNYLRYSFALPQQRLWGGPAQAVLLMTEFERIWKVVDPQKWLVQTQTLVGATAEVAMWPR